MTGIKEFRAYYPAEKHSPTECLALNNAGLSLEELVTVGRLARSPQNCFYVYRITSGQHGQTGIVACLDIKEYLSGKIKKHELTRTDKVSSQVARIKAMGCLTEPVLFTFNAPEGWQNPLTEWADANRHLYEIFDENAARHTIWELTDKRIIDQISQAVSNAPSLYICDGHHRMEALGKLYTQSGESGIYDSGFQNFFAAIFPSDEMRIIDYNRGVIGLNGLTKDQFLAKLEASGFAIESEGLKPFRPQAQGEFGMVIEGSWYRLKYMGEKDMSDPIKQLDIYILQNKVIRDILGITDMQNDERLLFISGDKRLSALESVSMQNDSVAFAVHPVKLEDIIRVSEQGLTMPPKSSRFDPRIMNGLLFYGQ